MFYTVLDVALSTVNLQDVFKSVERLCAEEGIDCAKFMYRDNTSILDTLEGHRFELCTENEPVYLIVLCAIECACRTQGLVPWEILGQKDGFSRQSVADSWFEICTRTCMISVRGVQLISLAVGRVGASVNRER